ncbi:MAG TPA: PAS domain S-box protein [Rubricoccaceae bacterium]
MDDLFPSDPDRYRLLVENTEAFALFMIDVDGVVRTWNPGAGALFGWTADAIVGQPCAVLWTPEDQATRADVNEREATRAVGEVPDERWHLRRDGTRVWVHGATTAVYDDDGQVIAFAKVGRDASMRQRTFEALVEREGDLQMAHEEAASQSAELRDALEAERVEVRRLANELAEASVREQRRLASVLHDDLQQLLVGATMRVHALRKTTGDDRAAAGLDAVARVLDAALTTTRTLTSQLVPPDVLTAPLPGALRWLAESFEDTHGLRVELDFGGLLDDGDGEVRGWVPLDGPVRLAVFRVVRELLFNVVKHAGTNEATVTVRSTDGAVTVVVDDDGVGVPADGGGAGYGRTDAENRLGAVGGTLSVRPRPGGGTRAVVRVPRRGDWADGKLVGAVPNLPV